MWYFGTRVEEAMEAAATALGPKAKGTAVAAARTRALNQILSTPEAKGMYRDPASIARRR